MLERIIRNMIFGILIKYTLHVNFDDITNVKILKFEKSKFMINVHWEFFRMRITTCVTLNIYLVSVIDK